MLNIIKVLVVLVSLFAGSLAGKNSCRQCVGNYNLQFPNYVSRAQATSFMKTSMGSCATGNDYNIVDVGPGDCAGGNKNLCRVWVFNLRVWRYCGNGGSVDLKKTNHGIGSLVASLDELSLTCTQSVECRGSCNCAECGC